MQVNYKIQDPLSNKLFKIFDWNKAARVISAAPIAEYWAGLMENWSATKVCIWKNGKPHFRMDQPRGHDGLLSSLTHNPGLARIYGNPLHYDMQFCMYFDEKSRYLDWPDEAVDILRTEFAKRRKEIEDRETKLLTINK